MMPPDDTALAGRCAALPTSTWSDALDACGLPASVLHGLLPRAGARRVAGPAVTVREETADYGSVPFAAFALGEVFLATSPGAVLVFAAGGARVSTFGGLAARHAQSRELAGILIDGACRDVEEVEAIGLPLWSTHVTPTSGKRRLRVAAIGEPAVCGGITVAPGDWIVADRTGIVVVPRSRLGEVLEAAEELGAREAAFEAALERGAAFGEASSRLGRALVQPGAEAQGVGEVRHAMACPGRSI